MAERIDINRFETLADAYGGDLDAWPSDLRAQAVAFAAADSRAKGVLDWAAALDALLDADPTPAPSATLTARVLADASTSTPETAPSTRTRMTSSRLRGLLRRLAQTLDMRPGQLAAGAAAIAGVGFVIGLVGAGAMNAASFESSELLELAFGLDGADLGLFGAPL